MDHQITSALPMTHLTALRPLFVGTLLALLMAACGGGNSATTPQTASAGGSDEPTAVLQVHATPADGAVEVAWRPVPGATHYGLTAVDDAAPETLLVYRIVSEPFLHTTVANGHTYRYRMTAIRNGSAIARGEATAVPGPVPNAVEEVFAYTQSGVTHISWTPVDGADQYEVFLATTRGELRLQHPFSSSVVATSTTVDVPLADDDARRFVVVQAVQAGRRGSIERPYPLPVFDIVVSSQVRTSVSLEDLNGDGCIDLPGSLGNCGGYFDPAMTSLSGLDVLIANGRLNNDVRIGDLNGDDRPDIYTNAYADARDGSQASILMLSTNMPGIYQRSTQLDGLSITGYGESIIFADFNGDGHVDVLDPHYWHRGDGGRNWLLINDGLGNFSDTADQSGLNDWEGRAPREIFVPEGTQSFDWDGDGALDVFMASTLFLNTGTGQFYDGTAQAGIPQKFDEGMRFADLDLDGDMDLIHLDAYNTMIYWNASGILTPPQLLDTSLFYTYGLNVCDVNGDAWPDVVISNNASTSTGTPRLYLNNRGAFVRSETGLPSAMSNDIIGCADLNNDGQDDLVVRGSDAWTALLAPDANAGRTIEVVMTDATGKRNQFGRSVTMTPLAEPSVRALRTVDGGAGYRAQETYAIRFNTRWKGPHRIEARFASGTVTTEALPGSRLEIREDGSVVNRGPWPSN